MDLRNGQQIKVIGVLLFINNIDQRFLSSNLPS